MRCHRVMLTEVFPWRNFGRTCEWHDLMIVISFIFLLLLCFNHSVRRFDEFKQSTKPLLVES